MSRCGKRYVPVLKDDLDWLMRCGKSALNDTEARMQAKRDEGGRVSPSRIMSYKRNRRRFRRVLRALQAAVAKEVDDD